MACPQKKTSKARKNKRRAHHFMAIPGLAKCKRCGAATPPHALCTNCGHYRGKPIIDVEA